MWDSRLEFSPWLCPKSTQPLLPSLRVLIHLPLPGSSRGTRSSLGFAKGKFLQTQPKSLIPPGSKGEVALTQPGRTERGSCPALSAVSRPQECSQADLSVCLEHQCLPKQIARKAPQIAGGLLNWEEGREPQSKTHTGSTEGRDEHG